MSPTPQLSASQAKLLLIALWALMATWLVVKSWPAIRTLHFDDPDDALRLVQVRDFLAGQSWFDMVQHRLNPPMGVPMHWSRLVDLPLALSILTFEPVFGRAMAEQIALTLVPLGALLVLLLIVYGLCRALALQRITALLAAALLITSFSIIMQFFPNRIDHHGTQLLFGGLAMIALVRPGGGRRQAGLIAGMAMAGWLQISMEGLPTAVAIGGVFGLRSLWRAEEAPGLSAYLIGLTGGSALLLFALHLPADALVIWCDAMSPAYLLPLAATTATLLLARRLLPDRSVPWRLAPLALAGLAGATAYLVVARQCLAGPFGALDPIVQEIWYRSVLEGMPVYRQKPNVQILIILPVLLGLPGTIIGLRRADTDAVKAGWCSLLLVQLASFLLALDVMRAMSFAHLLSLPGNAVLVATLMRRAQQLRLMPPRVVLTALTMVLTPFGTVTATAAALSGAKDNATPPAPAANGKTAEDCTRREYTHGIAALPVSTFFTPIDIGSHLLAYTPHSVVGTGHHRNVQGMNAVVTAFMAEPAEARTIVTRTPARYLAICEGYNEAQKYKRLRPRGLAAALIAGRTPDWLVPVPMRPGEPIKVYRIVRPSA